MLQQTLYNDRSTNLLSYL